MQGGEKNHKQIFPKNILQSILVIVIIVFYSSLTLFILERFFDDLGIKVTLNFLISVLLTLISMILINRILGVNLRFKLKVYNFKLLIISSIVIVSFVFSFNTPLNRAINSLIDGEISKVSNPFESLLLVFTTCILAPILEEFIFRGIILRGLLESYSKKFSILISSVIFAIVHLSPSQILGAFIFGLFFGLVYSKTRSLGYTIILHFLANISGLFSVYLNYTNQGVNDSFKLLSVYGNQTSLILFFSFVGFALSVLYFVKNQEILR